MKTVVGGLFQMVRFVWDCNAVLGRNDVNAQTTTHGKETRCSVRGVKFV